MSRVRYHTYIGDISSSDGRNKKNMAKRKLRLIGIITDIIHYLEKVGLGKHYMEVATVVQKS